MKYRANFYIQFSSKRSQFDCFASEAVGWFMFCIQKKQQQPRLINQWISLHINIMNSVCVALNEPYKWQCRNNNMGKCNRGIRSKSHTLYIIYVWKNISAEKKPLNATNLTNTSDIIENKQNKAMIRFGYMWTKPQRKQNCEREWKTTQKKQHPTKRCVHFVWLLICIKYRIRIFRNEDERIIIYVVYFGMLFRNEYTALCFHWLKDRIEEEAKRHERIYIRNGKQQQQQQQQTAIIIATTSIRKAMNSYSTRQRSFAMLFPIKSHWVFEQTRVRFVQYNSV